MNLGLDGKVALVTGAGGLLGGPIAKGLAAEGCRVVVHHRGDTDRQAAAAVADEIDGALATAELTDEAQVRVLYDAVEADFGPVEICVANAGRFPRDSNLPLWEIPIEQWRATIEDNLAATFLTAREWARRAVPRGEGALVMLSSAAGLHGQPDHADYSSAKSAIAGGLLKTLKNELGRVSPGLRVNVVAPAWTAFPEQNAAPQEIIDANVATQALAQLGTPDDVAHAVAWLCSPTAAGHVTGEVVPVTGGMEGRIIHPPEAGNRKEEQVD